jgi:uncharacterized protein (TIGR00369 family)
MQLPSFPPADADFEARVRASFALQPAMVTIGGILTVVTPGYVEIELPVSHKVLQQHGWVHGGVTGMIADSACGYASYSLMPAGASPSTVEYKINMLAPAKGDKLIARGMVLKPGRTLFVTRADVVAVSAAGEALVAVMQATMFCNREKPDH